MHVHSECTESSTEYKWKMVSIQTALCVNFHLSKWIQ